jgi:D-sedoheptulose 7-phosphate isomerase
MDSKQFIQNHLQNSIEVKQKLIQNHIPAIEKAAKLIIERLRNGNKLLLCGNGGSAADAQHIAAELVVRLKSQVNRPAIPALALTVDTSILTAGGNDYGFDSIFARQVEALGQEGDVLIGISTSGNSSNVVRAIEKAREKRLRTIGLLGGNGGSLLTMVDHAIVIPTHITAHIQESHITVGHILCDLIEQSLFSHNPK